MVGYLDQKVAQELASAIKAQFTLIPLDDSMLVTMLIRTEVPTEGRIVTEIPEFKHTKDENYFSLRRLVYNPGVSYVANPKKTPKELAAYFVRQVAIKNRRLMCYFSDNVIQQIVRCEPVVDVMHKKGAGKVPYSVLGKYEYKSTNKKGQDVKVAVPIIVTPGIDWKELQIYHSFGMHHKVSDNRLDLDILNQLKEAFQQTKYQC